MRLSLEALEDRIVPAGNTYFVNVSTDIGVGQGNTGDLRYCLALAMANPGSTISIQVVGAVGLTRALPAIDQNVDILGNGKAAVSGSGNANNLFSVFSINKGATVAINQLSIENGFDTVGGGILKTAT